MKKSKYNVLINKSNGEKIIYNTRTLGLSIMNEAEYSIYNNIENGGDKLVVEDLYESGFVIDDDCDEIKIIKNRLNHERYNKESLRVTIAPTLNCNFACIYCYEMEGEKKDYSTMNEDTQENLLNFINKRLFGCKGLSLVWYGGEPLLSMDIIKRLSDKIIKMCEERQIVYSAMMITNGYLLNQYGIKELKSMKIQTIQVTLDGPQTIHDSRRILEDGTGTYRKIIDNVKKIQNDFEIIIRVNIDKTNNRYLEDLMYEIKNNGIENIIFSIAPVLASKEIKENKCFKTKEFADLWIEFNDNCQKHDINFGSYVMPQGSHYCDADSDNGFVIDANGYIYKCWRDIGNVTKSVGNLNSNMEYSSLYYEYMTYDATMDEKCTECKVLPICMGGCPYDRKLNLERCTRYKYALKDIIMRMVREEE